MNKELLELLTDLEGELDNANNCLPEYNANSDSRVSIDSALNTLYVIREKLETQQEKELMGPDGLPLNFPFGNN